MKDYTTYYLTYRVHEDNYCYCVYITARSEEEARSQLTEMEDDLKVICGCEVAY